MYLFNYIHSNYLFKTLPQSFYIAHSQKIVRASSTPSPQVRIPVGDPVSPPPFMLTLYYLEKNYKRASVERRCRRTGGGRRKNVPSAWKLSGGGIIILGGRRWAKNSKKVSQWRKLSHSTKNSLFQILIHCEISSAQN